MTPSPITTHLCGGAARAADPLARLGNSTTPDEVRKAVIALLARARAMLDPSAP